MQTIIGITLIYLVLSTNGDEVCSTDEWGINVCKDRSAITRITNIGRFPSLKYLYLSLENNTTINSYAFNGLEIIDLQLVFPSADDRSSLHCLSLQSATFAGLSKLTILMIENADISFTGNPWTPLGSLLYLQFKNCNFNHVPIDILSSLPNLEELSLENNQISSIDANAFASLKHLKILNLSKNNITSLVPGCFNGLNKLLTLDLYLNSLTPAAGMFSGLDNLSKLEVSHALINNGLFEPSILQDLPNLTHLSLSDNNLTSLQPGMFNANPKINRITLYGNCIRNISKSVFSQLKSLKFISLADNQIETIESHAFFGLNLTNLNLAGNSLKTIETDTFSGLSVDHLNLRNNDIEELKPRAFSGLTAKVVYLSENRLMKIGSDDLSGLITDDLDLRGNVIDTVAQEAFAHTGIKRIKNDLVKSPDE